MDKSLPDTKSVYLNIIGRFSFKNNDEDMVSNWQCIGSIDLKENTSKTS